LGVFNIYLVGLLRRREYPNCESMPAELIVTSPENKSMVRYFGCWSLNNTCIVVVDVVVDSDTHY